MNYTNQKWGDKGIVQQQDEKVKRTSKILNYATSEEK